MADVEWLILADAAQVVGGKLYVLGGGWDVLTMNRPFPSQHRMAVAVSFRVPWVETNQKHNAQIELVTEEAKTLFKIDAQFEVGRPPGIKGGQEQRMQVAADLAVQFDGPGTYELIVRLESQERTRTPFNVVAGPGAGPIRRPAP